MFPTTYQNNTTELNSYSFKHTLPFEHEMFNLCHYWFSQSKLNSVGSWELLLSSLSNVHNSTKYIN